MLKIECHIGKLIRDKIEEKGYSKGWLASEIGCCRTNIYKILNKPSMDTAMLQKISLALNRNFFEELSDCCRKSINAQKKIE